MRRVLLLVLLVACRHRAHASSTPDASVTVQAAEEPKDSGPARARISFARFGENGVDECADTEIDADRDASAILKARPKGTTLLKQACSEAFSDRTELAGCVLAFSGDGGTVEFTSHYYDAIALDDDQYMKDCLEAGGKWSSLKKNSPEFTRSRLHGHTKQLKKLTQPQDPE